MAELNRSQVLFLEALRCALRRETVPWTEELPHALFEQLLNLAWFQKLLPPVAEAVCPSRAMAGAAKQRSRLYELARRQTIAQARRTADFLLLYAALRERGLRPVVMKGLVCRSLYPEPEQRSSTDEDLLITPEELPRYHEALLAWGLHRVSNAAAADAADEISYTDESGLLYLELHLRPFPTGSEAYGDCNRCLEGALSRAEDWELCGTSMRTLAPTDHLLYLICHAYKHLLHSGVGLRQLCDIALFAERFCERIDWPRVRTACAELRLEHLVAAIFRIGELHLGVPAPSAFADQETDELPLLIDCLVGGLYGSDDMDRLHSSTITLEAVASQKRGRRSRGLARTLFPPASALAGRYPYLHKRPWLLPAAWTQRFWNYAFGGQANPGRSVQIGRERIELLRRYQILP